MYTLSDREQCTLLEHLSKIEQLIRAVYEQERASGRVTDNTVMLYTRSGYLDFWMKQLAPKGGETE